MRLDILQTGHAPEEILQSFGDYDHFSAGHSEKRHSTTLPIQ